ncbi:thioredoxin domain-containing protein [Paenibacillus senegalensis]|nr:thioredoxin domain-containing protein [Paenibacillus senegalensis]
MAQESFEDEKVAAWLNAHYIAVKVDREERPDVDKLYMSVCQAMTGQGGWPLTVLMTPDKKPFFVGTYFPKTSQYGKPGVIDIVSQVHQKWTEQREELLDIAEEIAETVRNRQETALSGELSADMLDMAYELFSQAFDSQYGGFGDAPKFPSPHQLSFLLRYYKRTGEQDALDMAEKTLEGMHRGGMYDHIGYGFARCSADERWLVPHFEKMLYDNALLAAVYLEAYEVTGKQEYAEIAEQIFAYVKRDMTSSEGFFFSAEGSHSEGAEEQFYLWTPEEVNAVLGEEDGELFCDVFDIQEDGPVDGYSVPNLLGLTRSTFARLQRMDPAERERRLERSRVKLFQHRERRARPHKDDKMLTAWNGLMIMALAKGAKVLQKAEHADAAQKAVGFILQRLVREDGRLLARYRDGDAAIPAYLDDYAFLVWGLIELYEATRETEYLHQAVRFNQEMIRLFWDDESGGFYFSGIDGEKLLARSKEIHDGDMPSGNSAAAMNLLRLASLTEDTKLLQLAHRQLRSFAAVVEQYPAGFSMYLCALDSILPPKAQS